MCSNPAVAFAWVGVVLINVAFSVLLGWGLNNSWIIGFPISLVYTAVLFGLARLLERKAQNTDDTNTDDTKNDRKGLLFIASILYALGVIAVGVTGVIIPFAIFTCDYDDIITTTYTYITDDSKFPSDVQDWYRTEFDYSLGSSYTHINGVTLFSGKIPDTNIGGLFKINTTDPTSSLDGPQLFSNVYYPEELTSILNKTTCFSAYESESSDSRILQCTDGNLVVVNSSLVDPFDLFASDGNLWFRQSSTSRYSNGIMIYSLNPNTMETMAHTEIKDTEEVPLFECDQELLDRRLALFSMFFGMLPTVTVSLLIWHKLYIPTMPITTYFSATWFIAVLPIIFPSLKELFDPFDIMKWWFALSSGLWLLGLFLFYLANRVRKETLKWSLNFAALVYFASMFVVTDVFNDGFWFGWIIINVVSFAPLIFVGIVSDQIFLLVLAAIGIFVDVWKIGASIGNSVPVYFLLFGVSGIGLGYFGLILNKHQQKIASEVKNKAKSWLGNFVKDSVDISDTETALIETGVRIISKTEEHLYSSVHDE